MTPTALTPTLYSYSPSKQQPIAQENLSDTSKYKVVTILDSDSDRTFRVFREKLVEIVNHFSSVQVVGPRDSLSQVCDRVIEREQGNLNDKQLVVLALTANSPPEGFLPISGWFGAQAIGERHLFPTEKTPSNSKLSALVHEVTRRINQIKNLADLSQTTSRKTYINDLVRECRTKEVSLKTALKAENKRLESVKSVQSEATSPEELQLPLLNMADFNNPALRPQFVKDLHAAITTYGFFGVQNVGIDSSIINRAQCCQLSN